MSKSFQPVIQENEIRAGGMKIAEIRDGCLVFEDRWRNRCVARGTPDVPVELWDLLEELRLFYEEGR